MSAAIKTEACLPRVSLPLLYTNNKILTFCRFRAQRHAFRFPARP